MDVCMALSTDQAPRYGGGTLVIEFPSDRPLLPDATYYLIYEGSEQRHVTTARKLSPHKLHSIIPGHNEAEQVQLSAICCHGDSKDLVTTSPFHFHNDGAFYLAQFLVDSVYNPIVLEDLELIKSDHFDLSNEDLATLDQRLSRSLAHLDFPDWWNLLGSDASQAKPEPRESVLHFAARLGLSRVAGFMIGKPGSREVIQLPNKNGQLPKDVALASQNYGLAELLSEYNAHGFMPLSQWFETEKGIIQTGETGDVTLTSKLLSHQRTLEEDIAVLIDIQKQLEEDKPLRQWQTDWPSNQIPLPDENIDLPSRIERKLESICQKAHNLPNLISLESMTNNEDHENQNDSGMIQDDSGLSDIPNDSGLADIPAPDYDMDDNAEDRGTEGNLPNLHISEDDDDAMEECMNGLHRYNEDLLRIREKSVVFNRILEQDIRKENLARFSSSCPALDVDRQESPLPVIDEADHCKSMVDLADGDDQPTGKAESGSLYSEDCYSSSGDIRDPNIQIVVDGVTQGSTDTEDLGHIQEYGKFLKEYYGGNIPNVRRRSFSPEEVNRQVGVTDGQTDIPHASPTMLLDGEKRTLLSEEDSEEDILSGEDKDDVDGISTIPEPRKPLSETRGKSLGDMPNEEPLDLNQDASLDDMQGFQGARSPGAARSPGSGRGQSANKARYSADIEYLMRQQKDRHSGSSLDGSQVSPQSGNSTEEEVGVVKQPYHSKMTKALSTPSIPMATKAEKYGGFKGLGHDSKHAQFHRQREVDDDDPTAIGAHSLGATSGFLNSRRRKKAQVSLFDFLNDPSNFSGDSSPGPLSPAAKKEKEKRKTSRFSIFQSSVRGKKTKEKDQKGKAGHKFVSASVSNSMICDVCRKSLAHKPALRCEICLVNIHENTCKEHVTPCDRHRSLRNYGHGRQGSGDGDSGYSGQDRNVSNLRPSYSFKEKQPRQQQPFVGATSQPLPVSVTGTQATPELQQDWRRHVVMRRRRPNINSTQLNRRSLPSRVIVEELEHDPSASPRLDLGRSNITDAISRSVESLDEFDGQQEFLCEDDVLHDLDREEPETWSETCDKKAQKKMHLTTKDTKRQDTIWELIQTERQYCKRLKTLQIFFRDGMIQELHMDPVWVDRLFPGLDDLIHIHMAFLQQLKELQMKREDRFVEEIGPTLVSQFSGESAEQMKYCYGVFCSGHLEAVQAYKEQFEKDRNFHAFIRKRYGHPICGKREPPDFILLITQRPTKYPTLIEAVIKNTKDKKDRESLVQALDLSKDILQNVNEQIAVSERQMRLNDIYARLDGRSYATHRGKKFKKDDLKNGRKLLHEGMVEWKRAGGKYTEVVAVVLTDVLVFLQESNQKYTFYTQDNKFGVVSLFNLLVREKGDTRDSRGLYLISQNKQNPEMYEILCHTPSQRHVWAKALRAAVEKCPEEEDEVPSEEEEERRRQEEKMAKARRIMDKLHEKDEEIRACCDVKNKLMIELLRVYSDNDEQHNSRPNSRDFEETSSGEHTGVLQAAIQEVSIAASQLTNMLQGSGTSLNRSVSSVGERTSNSYSAVPVPKRAETFAGFDSNSEMSKVPMPKKRGTDEADYTVISDDSLNIDKDTSQSDISQYSEHSGPQQYRYEGIDQDSGRGSSLSAISSASTLSPMSAVSGTPGSMDQSSIEQLLRTLNSIVHLTASQGTAVETLRAQLAEANERINKLSADMHERKSGYKHSQLEELRNLQTTVQKEKQDWERHKAKELQMMEAERAQLEEMRSILAKQETEIKAQKEDLKKQREVLQLQTEMLREQGKLPKDPSLSHLGAGSGSDTESTDSLKGHVQSQSDFQPGHKRSASAELGGKIDNAHMKESFRNEHKSLGSKTQSFSIANKQMPMHLMSAKNELKVGSKNIQQLPSKLSSSSASPPHPGGTGGAVQAGLRQMAPGTAAGGIHHTSSGSNISGPQVSVSHGGSSPSLTSEGATHGQDSNADQTHLGHSSSASHIGNHGNTAAQGQHNNYGSSVVMPMGSRHSNRPKPSSQPPAGISGLMKLAEKGDKKGKSSSQLQGADKGSDSPPQGQKKSPEGQPRPKSGGSQKTTPSISHKPQKSDSDVIYF